MYLTSFPPPKSTFLVKATVTAGTNSKNLDKALETAAKKFVNDERHFKVDPKKKEVYISKIFEWYGPKFTKDPKPPAKRPELYLTNWTDPELTKMLESGDYKLRIIEWDWTLNEKVGGSQLSGTTLT